MSLKGISIISGVIFLALTITATAIIYQAGTPLIQQLQGAAAVDKMTDTLSDLDDTIRTIASEGSGSKRTITISSDPGKLIINGSTDTITWELDTESPVVSPRTSQEFGNLVVGSNLETSVTEGNYTRVTPEETAFILENSRVIIYINKTGTSSSQLPIVSSKIVLAIYNKDLNSWIDNVGFLDISIDNNANSKLGTGYTEATSTGAELPFGEVRAFMDTSYVDYWLTFTLESGADFLKIEAEEA